MFHTMYIEILWPSAHRVENTLNTRFGAWFYHDMTEFNKSLNIR